MDNMYALLYEYKMEELSILESYMFEPIYEGAIGLVLGAIKMIFATLFKLIRSIFEAIGNLFNISSSGGSGSVTKLKNSKIYNNNKQEVSSETLSRELEMFTNDIKNDNLESEDVDKMKETMEAILATKISPKYKNFESAYYLLVSSTDTICNFRDEKYIEKITKSIFPAKIVNTIKLENGVYKLDYSTLAEYFFKANSEFSKEDAEQFLTTFKNCKRDSDRIKSAIGKAHKSLEHDLKKEFSEDNSEELTKVKTLINKNSVFITTLLATLADFMMAALAYAGAVTYLHKIKDDVKKNK